MNTCFYKIYLFIKELRVECCVHANYSPDDARLRVTYVLRPENKLYYNTLLNFRGEVLFFQSQNLHCPPKTRFHTLAEDTFIKSLAYQKVDLYIAKINITIHQEDKTDLYE